MNICCQYLLTKWRWIIGLTMGAVFLMGLEAISPSTPKVVSTVISSSTLLPLCSLRICSFRTGERLWKLLSPPEIDLQERKRTFITRVLYFKLSKFLSRTLNIYILLERVQVFVIKGVCQEKHNMRIHFKHNLCRNISRLPLLLQRQYP